MPFGEVEGLPVENGSGQIWSFGLEDLERALPFLAAIGAHQIEVMPVGGDFGPEVGVISESFAVEKLVFDQAMDRFHVALPSVTFGRDVAMV